MSKVTVEIEVPEELVTHAKRLVQEGKFANLSEAVLTLATRQFLREGKDTGENDALAEQIQSISREYQTNPPQTPRRDQQTIDKWRNRVGAVLAEGPDDLIRRQRDMV